MKSETGPMNPSTRATKTTEVVNTDHKAVENTFLGSSPSLLAKRKKAVSIPYVRMTSSKAV